MGETKVNSENYFVVQGWMLSELGLKNNELLVYAIIYGFSQGGNKFTGSLQYLCDWTNSGKTSVQNCLKSLREKGLIEKEENTINGVKFCKYYATKCWGITQSDMGITQSDMGITQSDTNNIDNNINNTVSKDTGRKKSLYEQCMDVIDVEFHDTEIKEELKSYLTVRIKSGRMSARSFRTIILEINELADTKEQAINIIRNATAKGYMKFYPVKQYAKKNSYQDNIQKKPDTEEDALVRRYREEMMGLLPDEKISYEEWRKSNG